MRSYDLVIAGGGVAGLSLAYHLLQSPLRDRSIAIIDQERKTRNDRTLSYWTAQPMPFDDLAFRSWDRLRVIGEDFESTTGLGRYRYHTIRGLDFYQHIQHVLAAYPNVEFIQGTISRIDERDQGAVVRVDDQTPCLGQWVFDSRTMRSECLPMGCRIFQQQFQGWEIETEADVFDPQTPIFMDFRTPQHSDLRFCYVLPFSERRALVEYVQMGQAHTAHGHALKRYIESMLGIDHYQVLAREGGTSPLTDWCFPRRTGPHTLSIGTRGGRVKPSSGYAFTRIQRDSAAIVRSLANSGHPFDIPPDARFYRLCDTLMLRVMDQHGDWLTPIFLKMFKANPIERIFGFLDESASPGQTVRLTTSLLPELAAQSLLRRELAPQVDHSL